MAIGHRACDHARAPDDDFTRNVPFPSPPLHAKPSKHNSTFDLECQHVTNRHENDGVKTVKKNYSSNLQNPHLAMALLRASGRSPAVNSAMIVTCAGCDKPILDKFLCHVLDRPWHAVCVRCYICGCTLSEKCLSRENKLFCRNDFYKTFGQQSALVLTTEKFCKCNKETISWEPFQVGQRTARRVDGVADEATSKPPKRSGRKKTSRFQRTANSKISAAECATKAPRPTQTRGTLKKPRTKSAMAT
ncbi:unnamed protein product [Bemisia tabaci]|uniref:LIM zinc-binding domain-containing protein n=1 Tax=Bemisia tabaci TaxID=7038 RepID=A0A9P0F715_BEMTA|nr:unnamed protein product [Bemisia tabaci]